MSKVPLQSRMRPLGRLFSGCRFTSPIRKRTPLGPYSRTMPRVLWGS